MLAATASHIDIAQDPRLFAGTITSAADDGWMVDGAYHCSRATGCLLEPCADDLVLWCETGEGSRYVLSVLSRQHAGDGRLSVEGAAMTSLSARRLNLSSSEEMTVSSLGNMVFNAALGNLHIHAQNLFSTAAGSIVETAQSYIGKVTQYSLTALGLLRQHGKHQVVTADQDVRIDGERITMG